MTHHEINNLRQMVEYELASFKTINKKLQLINAKMQSLENKLTHS